MEINLNVISEHIVESTTTTKKMKLSNHASQMVFQMFTKNVYSNPIGTVVREITSNCFDSHVEAGVQNSPVLIKKTHDESTDTTYISFIDYGMGMSQDRVENIYGVYFESTKRETNDQIGGFGIGGKTPLAYKRSTGVGEGEYDNSFFVITNYNGTKFYYNIYEGTESPEFSLFHQEETNEINGTEIRIPVLQRDLGKFEQEIKKQLMYFEGIVFEGFSDYVTNDYQIIEGKTFLYREDCFTDKMHVCVGKVYYPIDYDLLGLSSYDYKIPVGIKVPIGAVNVTVSREQLDYSEGTIKYIKDSMDLVQQELKEMLTKQHENVVTLIDFFKYRKSYGRLNMTEDSSIVLNNIVNHQNIDLVNFKYRHIIKHIPANSDLIPLLFKTSMYGKKKSGRSYWGDGCPEFNQSYEGILDIANNRDCNVLFSENVVYETPRIKQSYLKSYNKRFYVVAPRELDDASELDKIITTFKLEKNITNSKSPNQHLLFDSFNSILDFKKSQTYCDVLDMQSELFELIIDKFEDYNDVEVDEEFKSTYGRRKLSKDILKITVPIMFNGQSYSKERIMIKKLIEFKGKIFYGNSDDVYEMSKMYDIFSDLFGNSDNYVAGSDYGITGENNTIMFITMSKSNIKYMKFCKNALHLSKFYNELLYRKEDDIMKTLRCKTIVGEFESVNEFLTNRLVKEIYPEWSDKIESVRNFIKNISINHDTIEKYRTFIEKHVSNVYGNVTKDEINIRKELDYIMSVDKKNDMVIKYLEIPDNYYSVIDADTDRKMRKKIYDKLIVF